MNHKVAQMMVERLLFVVGFPSRRFIGDGDVAEHARRILWTVRAARLQRRKRQHVGRLVDAAPSTVQCADAGVVGQHDRELGASDIGCDELGRGRNRPMDDGLGVRLGLPAIGDNKNF